MEARRTAPFGSWRSPITAASLARAGIGLGGTLVDAGDIYWIETRPTEAGRNVIVVRSADGTIQDVTPQGYNARTRVHEYGGGPYFVHDGTVFFSNFDDQRLYRQDAPDEEPRPITAEPEEPCSVRFADGRVAPDGSIVCVRERHSDGTVTIELVRLPPDGSSEPRVLASGHDFYSFPRADRDGRTLAWTTWDHPRMPWDGTELWTAELTPDGLGPERLVAGGPSESIVQPAWGPDGALYFVSDRTGWWNLYRLEGDTPRHLIDRDAEFGGPQWLFDFSFYDFMDDGRIACIYSSAGSEHLALVDPDRGTIEDIDLPYTSMMPSVRIDGSRILLAAASATEARSIVAVDASTGRIEVLRRSSTETVDPLFVSVPRAIEFPTEGGVTAHALFYPPTNPDFESPPSERPPLIVHSHGGPTGGTSSELDYDIQFFTSRGLAVVDVNYGGSTGYGRAYRERLNGRWGIVDTDDCINAALHLVRAGEVDGERLAIRGGSAGGYTTLCALTFHDIFSAGASYFGVADLETFVHETHNFESRYIDGLVGPYPEAADVYRERSPVHFADRISRPLILFQGLEDEIVPPKQAEVMVEALRRNRVPFAYVAFEGEQHGFRRAENIQRCAEAELYFYGRMFGFEPADEIEPVEIENL